MHFKCNVGSTFCSRRGGGIRVTDSPQITTTVEEEEEGKKEDRGEEEEEQDNNDDCGLLGGFPAGVALPN